MAQATRAQIDRRVRRYLKERNPDTSFWSRNFMGQLINGAYRRRSAQLIMAFEGWFVQVAMRDLTADKDRYAYPDNFERQQKLEVVRSDGRTVPIERFERHNSVNNPDSGTQDVYTPTYRLLGNGFVLEPTPSASVTNGLRLEYVGTPIELESDGDALHPSWPAIWTELLVLDAAIMAFDAEGQQESGLVRSLLRLRSEWEFDWERFIDSRSIARQRVDPFSPHYADA